MQLGRLRVKFLRDHLLLAASAATLAVSAPSTTLAQSMRFNIPAGPLPAALNAYAQAVNRQIAFTQSDVGDFHAPALEGNYTPEQALQRLLKGTGLIVTRTPSGVLVVTPARAKVVHAVDSRPAPASDPPPQRQSLVEPAASPAGRVEEVVVTARRREERLQDVPISISVFNQAQLENRNVVDVGGLMTKTPSLAANEQLGSLNVTYSIRGFTQDAGTQPSVGVYFADVVAPRAATTTFVVGDGNGPGSFMDLQSVQVLKGPQGTLFGRNTTGGAILLTPVKPTSKYAGYLQGSFGNYSYKNIEGAINIPFSERVRFRLAGEYQDRDGYLLNYSGIGPSTFDDSHYYALRASLVVDLTPELENYTIATYSNASQNGDIDKVITASAGFPFGPLAAGQLARAAGRGFFDVYNPSSISKAELTQWQVINTTTWHATDHVTLKNIISYGQFTEDLNLAFYGADFDAADLNPLHIPGFGPYPTGTAISFAELRNIPGGHMASQSTFSEELQLQGSSADRKLTWQTGVYAELSDPLGLSGNSIPATLNCGASAYFCSNPLGFGALTVLGSKVRFRDYAGYGQASYMITPQLTVTGGIRYTYDKVSGDSIDQKVPFEPSLVPIPASPPVCLFPDQAPSCTNSQDLTSKAPTWLIDLEYKPNEDNLAYFKYSRGYRAGNLQFGLPAQFTRLKQEKLDTYELGLKSRFHGQVSGTVNMAAFYNNFFNQQLQVDFLPVDPSYTPTAGSVNIGKSEIYGVEFDTSLIFFHALTVDASYTYLHTRVQSVTLPATPPGSPYALYAPILPGDPLAYAPEHKATIELTYQLPLNSEVGDVSIGGTYSYTSSQVVGYLDRDASGKLNGQSLLAPRNILDLNLNWKSVYRSAFDLSIFATNVTNKKYYTSYVEIPGVTFASIGEPCMYGVRLKYHW
jgi:iron complex outermembrane receptor protein